MAQYKSQNRSLIKWLNTLPFPQYDFEDFTLSIDEVILPLEFGRGCPWKKCTFCPDHSYNICQTKSPDYLKAEIKYYQDISEDLRNFFILDSDALKDKKSILDLSEYLQIGIETFSDRILVMMNKGVTVLKNIEVLKAVAELNVPVQFNLFTCYPGMTIQDMFENKIILWI